MSGSAHDGLVLDAPGGAFRLNVLGYQFPGAPDEDGEWLMIAGQASAGDRSWEFREPCLMAGELVSLIAWLRAIADGRDAALDRRIDFLEPELALEFERIAPSQIRLTIELALAAAPPWWDTFAASGEGLAPFRLPLTVSPDHLRLAADGLASAAPNVIARQAARGQLL